MPSYFTTDTKTLRVGVKNNGTLDVFVTVHAELLNSIGNVAMAAPGVNQAIGPGSSATVDFIVSFASLAPGSYTPKATVLDSATGNALATLTGEQVTIAMPVPKVAISSIAWV